MGSFQHNRNKSSSCLYCGANANSREHVPPISVFKKPYPQNLITVPACQCCNNSYSQDERYLFQLLNFLKLIHEISDRDIELNLEDRFFNSLKVDENNIMFFYPEHARIKKVVEKISLGHLYEKIGIVRTLTPVTVEYSFLPFMSMADILNWETIPINTSWVISQKDTYRYAITTRPRFSVKAVVQEFCYLHVVWR